MSLEIMGITANGLAVLPALQSPKVTTPQFEPAPAQKVSPPQKERQKPDPELLKQTLREIEKFTSFLNRRLKYSVNQELDQVVVKVIDSETDRVVKVLPPEELQRLHARIRETVGLLFDETI
ncbi:MAG: flagellar protein FlaG [Spirochaetales bacterium]|jgi:flagellar protein FlaG|nr:flagellar protein FlaG [Spirochaetales bacterium]